MAKAQRMRMARSRFLISPSLSLYLSGRLLRLGQPVSVFWTDELSPVSSERVELPTGMTCEVEQARQKSGVGLSNKYIYACTFWGVICFYQMKDLANLQF